MRNMDRLWVHHFDKAFDNIPLEDSSAYRQYADHLDEFFVNYWSFFSAWTSGENISRLEFISSENFSKTMRSVKTVWEITIHSQLRAGRRLRRGSRAINNTRLARRYRKATDLLKNVRKGSKIKRQLRQAKEVSNLLDSYIKSLELTK